MENIEFQSKSYTNLPNDFNEQQYFKTYHFYQSDSQFIMNFNVPKTGDNFDFDFGHGFRTYRYELYEFTDRNNTHNARNEIKYIIARQILTGDEAARLIPYCQCSICSKSFIEKLFNPINALFACPCCVGCLKENEYRHPPQWNIDQSHEAYINSNSFAIWI